MTELTELREVRGMENMEREYKRRQTIISWQEEVPIFRNPLIRKQLGIAIGIPFGILILVLSLVIGPERELMYILGMLGALFFLTFLLVKFYLGDKYAVSYVADEKGISYSTQRKQYERSRKLNILTVILGILSRSPSAAGAGLLAQSRQRGKIPWNRVRTYHYLPKSQALCLELGPLQKEYIFCTPEQYENLKQTYLAN